MSRLVRATLASIVVLAASPLFAADEPSRPNFVIILCDDLGYGDLACYGNETIKTPHLDQLAREGLRLTACYSASPLCSPARAGLLTGRTPSRAGIYSWIAEDNPMHLRQDETTVAALLKSAGYQTCHVGKWHLNGKFNDPEHTQPGDHGFDHWFATQNNAAPSHADPTNFVRNGQPVGELEGFSCQLVVDEAQRFLESRDRGKAFFLNVWFHEPHEPVASPEELVALYPDATGEGEALYYANVTNMDQAVGRLMETLDRLDLRDNTLVFFTSDNGPETLNRYRGAWRSWGSPGPLRGMKLHIYEGGIRVAGILRYPPRIQAGTTSDEPVCGLDVLPAFAELAGVNYREETSDGERVHANTAEESAFGGKSPRVLPLVKAQDGASFTPVFDAKPIQRAKPLFWHYYGAYYNRQVALRDGRWKLVAGWDGKPTMGPGGSLAPGVVEQLKNSELVEFELYDLQTDLEETTNLAEARPEVLAWLSKTARIMYRNVIDEGPNWQFPPEN